MFSVFLAPYVDISEINCKLNWLPECCLSYGGLGSVELYERENWDKIYQNLFSVIFLILISVYIYVCTLCVFVCSLDTGRELGVQQDFQKSSRVSKERFVYVQNAGCFKGRYIYLVLIVDLNWFLLSN